LITENGVVDSTDKLRPDFLRDHIRFLMKARNEDHINVIGYLHWSLTDNFEWKKGIAMKYGLMSVNYDTLEKTKRDSFTVYQDLIKLYKGQE
jgi:beta-galactosidase